ncbi:DUF2642 domain-containing protein [Brevibacillus fluminis]|uniref:DUF2642 domain-containing protein n=1 Tax=Brevibacillus fluminis TaxID=511487 RepID=A0A3M8DXR4_9BACL|nr:DUF2642 domain-containing protein [Brevibacillus fluminis]RNB92021.1 DUF2642 domain-containing protein [Brevibacillus fluminis]
MKDLRTLIGKQLEVVVSGKNHHTGILIDAGLDLIVLYDGYRYLYIPIVHVQHFQQKTSFGEQIESPTSQVPFDSQTESISYRKTLEHARGRFVEIYVTGNQSIHGYVNSIMNDYFTFYSPVYKNLYISLNHVKWIIPYTQSAAPYSLDQQSFPVKPASVPLSRTFEQQCKRFVGSIVVFDLGEHPNKVGLLQQVDSNIIDLVKGNGEWIYWNLEHIKTIHVP